MDEGDADQAFAETKVRDAYAVLFMFATVLPRARLDFTGPRSLEDFRLPVCLSGLQGFGHAARYHLICSGPFRLCFARISDLMFGISNIIIFIEVLPVVPQPIAVERALQDE